MKLNNLDPVSQDIVLRLSKAINVISNSGLSFVEYGLFGSCARGDYDGCSDIDIVIITEEPLVNHELSSIRCELEHLNCDVANITLAHMRNPKSAFQRAVVRDYRRINYGQ